MKLTPLVLAALALLGGSGCDRPGNAAIPTNGEVKPMSGEAVEAAYATLKEHCTYTTKIDGETETSEVELDRDRNTLRLVIFQKDDKEGVFRRYRYVIDLQSVSPEAVQVHPHGGIHVQGSLGRKAITMAIESERGVELEPYDTLTVAFSPHHAAHEYATAAALRQLIQLAQGKPDERPAVALTDLLSGTHWAWYEGELVKYSGKLRDWVEFYPDGTARVSWRNEYQAWTVEGPDTVTVSDPKLGDKSTFIVNAANKSGSTENGQRHIRYQGRALKPTQSDGVTKGKADLDYAFARVKEAFAKTTTTMGLTETTALELDKANKTVTVQMSNRNGASPERQTFRFVIDFRNLDPAGIKEQSGGVRLQPYPGRKAITMHAPGARPKDMTYHHLFPVDPTQAPGAADALREMINAAQGTPPP